MLEFTKKSVYASPFAMNLKHNLAENNLMARPGQVDIEAQGSYNTGMDGLGFTVTSESNSFSLFDWIHGAGDLLVYGFAALVAYKLFFGQPAKEQRVRRRRAISKARRDLKDAKSLPLF